MSCKEELKNINVLYYDVNVRDKECTIYYNNCIYKIEGKLDYMADYIDAYILMGDKSIKIYGDTGTGGGGIFFTDCLYKLGYKPTNTKLEFIQCKSKDFSISKKSRTTKIEAFYKE